MQRFQKLKDILSGNISNVSSEQQQEALALLNELSKEFEINSFLTKKYKVDFDVSQTFLQASVKETKKREDELLDINLQLENFAFTVAHDLNTPMKTIISFSNLLEKTICSKSDPKSSVFLEQILISSKHMKNLIDDTLAFSKIKTTDIKKEEVDLNETISFIKTILLENEDYKENILVNSDTLPTLVANEAMMHKMLLNLITNGIKYNTKVKKCIDVNYEESETHFVIKVSDNGMGMREEDCNRIFDMYVRLHAASTYEGTGIGLAMCKRIALIHGGDLSVKSELGKGSEFSFTISKK